MTYFRDLTLYAYSRAARFALNVGWLDGAHEFETEPPSLPFLDALWHFVKAPVAQTRGLHECELCPRDRRDSFQARHNGEALILGSAEIRVFGEIGAIYAGPTLIYHYVEEHHYKPPGQFVRAVLLGARPPSDEYRALLRRHEIE